MRTMGIALEIGRGAARLTQEERPEAVLEERCRRPSGPGRG
jgi:hypothetical protein